MFPTAVFSSRSMRIIAALDSFKGSLTSREAGEACRSGIESVLPDADVKVVSVADGGEGTVEALTAAMNGYFVSCRVKGPLGEPVDAVYGVSADGKTAVMEMSQASGITLIPESASNPLKTDTIGTGQMLADAVARGCVKIIIGIGGSATVDGGIGMMSALGVRFLDDCGQDVVPCGAALGSISSIDAGAFDKMRRSCSICIACDVNNPLTGANGAARVFGPQKGASNVMIGELEKGMCSYAQLLNDYAGRDVASEPGAGAAGGLGAALMAFFDAKLLPGGKLMLDTIGFDNIVAGADLIITGEGCLDRQTLMGKIPFEILQAGLSCKIPVVAVGGCVENCDELLRAGFACVRAAKPDEMPLAEAMLPERAKNNLARTCAMLMRSKAVSSASSR